MVLGGANYYYYSMTIPKVLLSAQTQRHLGRYDQGHRYPATDQEVKNRRNERIWKSFTRRLHGVIYLAMSQCGLRMLLRSGFLCRAFK